MANGGSLTVSLPQTGTLTVVAGGNVVPGGLSPTDSALRNALAGQAFFQADRLAGSGIANLTLSAGIHKATPFLHTANSLRGPSLSRCIQRQSKAASIAAHRYSRFERPRARRLGDFAREFRRDRRKELRPIRATPMSAWRLIMSRCAVLATGTQSPPPAPEL